MQRLSCEPTAPVLALDYKTSYGLLAFIAVVIFAAAKFNPNIDNFKLNTKFRGGENIHRGI
jgi:hypothetical protein